MLLHKSVKSHRGAQWWPVPVITVCSHWNKYTEKISRFYSCVTIILTAIILQCEREKIYNTEDQSDPGMCDDVTMTGALMTSQKPVTSLSSEPIQATAGHYLVLLICGYRQETYRDSRLLLSESLCLFSASFTLLHGDPGFGVLASPLGCMAAIGPQCPGYPDCHLRT